MLTFLDAAATLCSSSGMLDLPPGSITLSFSYTKDGNLAMRLAVVQGNAVADWVGLVDRDLTDTEDPDATLVGIIQSLSHKLNQPKDAE